MTRLRSAAQRAPQTTEAATLLLARVAEIDAAIGLLDADRTAAIATLNGAADACIVPLDAERKDLAKQLKPWFEGNFDELTGGKRKSIDLGGCTIGYRTSPPKVTFAYGKDQDAVDALAGTGWDDELLRVKVTLDKPATLKQLQGDLDDELVPLELLGFAETQTEDFFIEPFTAGAGPA